MEKDTLIIRSEKPVVSGNWKPVTVTEEAYNAIKSLADETGHSLSKIACMLIEFSLERVKIEK